MSELGLFILGYKFWAILREFVLARGLGSRFPLSLERSFELIQSLTQFININIESQGPRTCKRKLTNMPSKVFPVDVKSI